MLTQMLWQATQANPAKVALVQGNRRLRYDQLSALAGSCSSGLRHLGVAPADCVAVVLPNCPEFIISLFACARLNAILLPLNPQYTREEMQRFLVDGQARVIITDAPRAALCQQIVADLDQDIQLIVVGERVAGAVSFDDLTRHPVPGPPTVTSTGPGLYLYTSGSTDAYKRLCCTQENLFFEAYNFVETVHLTAEDNILCTIPLYHSYGLGNCLLDAVYAGSTLVLLEPVVHNGVSVEAPFVSRCERVLALMREEAIRFYPGVPYQFAALAALPEDRPVDLSGLRWCISSGDVLPEQTYQRFLARFGLPIRSLYGSTEAGSICMNTDPAATVQFGSLGLALHNVAVQIRDAANRELPDNHSGQIWVKSPVIPPTGYDNRPELNAQVFCDGYYNTGDIGKKDARGHLVITGRKQTFVDVGGYKVDIGEVEEVLQSHPQVREAAALGVEVPDMGEMIKAVVVTQGPCQEADILAYCQARLASFKIPRVVEFRDALPRSPIGKVLKKELADVTAYLNRLGGGVTAAAALPASRFQQAFEAVSAQARAQQTELLATYIQEQVAATLQREVGLIPRSASFESLGFDSLRAAELQQRLVQMTGVPLSITMLWNYPSIDEFADALVTRMQASGEAQSGPAQALSATPPTSGSAPPPRTSLDALLNEVTALSEAEVDAFFRRPPRDTGL